MRKLVLASTSPYRRELLARLGISFEAAAPRFEEVVEQRVAPELLVKHLALGKAKSLSECYPDALIIGSDQIFVNPRGARVGKPGGFEAARCQLAEMSGKRSLFYTGIALYDSAEDQFLVDFTVTTVTFRQISDAEIRCYLLRERPFDCAGSFKIEGLGITLMEKVEGDDYTALIGLPLIQLNHMLISMGMNVLS
ncbi:MAG: septum formation protein Maf [Desulfuromonadaceae bacterium]|nr:septum formation protein Maf [Desulfuromonadaceae bacterium]